MRDVFDILQPSCAGLTDFSSRFLVRMLLPIMGLGIFGVTYLVSVAVGHSKPGWKLDLDKLFNVYFSAFYTLYISIAAVSFALFLCYPHPNGMSSMQEAPEVIC